MMIERSGKNLSARSGDPLTADMWNRMVRNVESVSAATIGMQSGAPVKAPASGLILKAENVADAALQPFEAVTIKGQGYQSPETKRDVLLQVGTAADDDDLASWAVVLDAVPVGGVGRVLTLGVAWVEYDPATSGAYAAPVAGARAVALGGSGHGLVLDTLPDEALALVRIPAGGANAHDGSTIIVKNNYVADLWTLHQNDASGIPYGAAFAYTSDPSTYEFIPHKIPPVSKALADGAGPESGNPGGFRRLAIALEHIPYGASGRCAIDGTAEALLVGFTSIYPAQMGRFPQPGTAGGTTPWQHYTRLLPTTIGQRLELRNRLWDFNVWPFPFGPLQCVGANGYPYVTVRFVGPRE